MFTQREIPQADNLIKVIETVEAIGNGAITEAEIADTIGYSERQGRYYRHAAEILGFVTNNANHAYLTTYGKTIYDSAIEGRKKLLKNAIYENAFLKSVIDFFEQNSEGVSEGQLIEFIKSITNEVTSATIERRTQTIISWLENVEIIIDVDDEYFFNDQIEEEIEDEPDQFKFPANFDQEVDIKEEWFSIFELNRQIIKDKVNMNPDFQRNMVWKPFQKSRFIESIILNIPLPPLYFRKDLNGNYIVVDGLQRTSTLQAFLSDKFELTGLEALPDLNKKRFTDLEEKFKTRIEDRKLLIHILQPNVPMKLVYDIFNRINTGGTKLERQEIRNCILMGQSTQLLKRLANSAEFKEAIDNGIPPTRMKDREAILRCIAFTIIDYQRDYNNSMDDFLERAMKQLNTMNDFEIAEIESKFKRIMALTVNLFGKSNFRLPTQLSRGRINIALLESIYYYFYSNDFNNLKSNLIKIKNNYKFLLRDATFIEAVTRSTSAKSRVLNRFNIVVQTLSK